MITLNITAESPKELNQQINELYNQFNPRAAVVTAAELLAKGCTSPDKLYNELTTATEASSSAEDAPNEPFVEPMHAETASEAATPEPEPEKPQVTEVEARAVLNELRKEQGAPAVKELLGRFGVKSFRDIKPEWYAAVVLDAKGELGQA